MRNSYLLGALGLMLSTSVSIAVEVDTKTEKTIAEATEGVVYVFLSIDTDVLDPAWAPGMGTPGPGGGCLFVSFSLC